MNSFPHPPTSASFTFVLLDPVVGLHHPNSRLELYSCRVLGMKGNQRWSTHPLPTGKFWGLICPQVLGYENPSLVLK